MTSELAPAPAANPFGSRQLANRANAGTVAIEQERAIAEAQGKMVIARRFPRDREAAYTEIMEACDRPGFAQEAIYTYSRGGKPVTGGTIRLAEEIARCWGHLEYGLRELSRREGESEMEAFAWDLQTGTRSVQAFTVRHIRDTKGGGTKLTDERDIYEIGANMGARRLRERIFALIPADVKRAAEDRCREILAQAENLPKLAEAFAAIGVTAEMLDKFLGKRFEAMLPEEIVDMRGVYKSIKAGTQTVADWFAPKPDPAAEPAPTDAAGKRRPRGLAAADKPAGTVAAGEAEKPATGGGEAPAAPAEPAPGDKVCEACGAVNPAEATDCAHCGHVLPDF